MRIIRDYFVGGYWLIIDHSKPAIHFYKLKDAQRALAKLEEKQ